MRKPSCFLPGKQSSVTSVCLICSLNRDKPRRNSFLDDALFNCYHGGQSTTPRNRGHGDPAPAVTVCVTRYRGNPSFFGAPPPTLPLFFSPLEPCMTTLILELVPAPRMVPVTTWTVYTMPAGYSYVSANQTPCQQLCPCRLASLTVSPIPMRVVFQRML